MLDSTAVDFIDPTIPTDIPHIEMIDTRGNLQIWLVNGTLIRGRIEEEFTNMGQPYRFSFIPENELWIDKDTKWAERPFFIDYILSEYKFMKKGIPYQEAAFKAGEIQERERNAILQMVGIDLKNKPDPSVMHIELYKRIGDMEAWIVNESLVRDFFFRYFVEGGNPFVYKFIPKNEWWIGDDVNWIERPFILFHEIHESNLMRQGLTYNNAHVDASKFEWHYRHNPGKLYEAFQEEVDKWLNPKRSNPEFLIN